MNFPCRWEVPLFSLWIQVGIVLGILCMKGTVSHLSREDVLLLKDEDNPKCFTRTERDFTCFFESADNRTYDLLYKLENPPREERCDMSVQRTEEGTFLHICSFPNTDVYVYVAIPLEVLEHNTNNSLYKRTVFVEDHLLMYPPFNVSLHHNGQAGQLQVEWHKQDVYCADVTHRIQYSSKGLGVRIKENQESPILDSLVPGEEVEVQVSVKCVDGHWSSWSHPVQAMVPQSADDVSLICFTSDLQNITCHWNGSTYGVKNGYKLFYKMCLGQEFARTNWTECTANENLSDLCRFPGDESRKVMVKLNSTASPFSRTFYAQTFTLNSIIRTSPPGHLRGTLDKGKLYLKWEAPLPSVLADLQYDITYQTKQGEIWRTVSLDGSDTGTFLEVLAGTQYSVKVRAKPRGSIYSGHWSDWSDVLIVDTPIDISILLMMCIPLLMLVTAVILIFLFSTYLSKFKQYFWPPVPNLDKVLQGFLTEISNQKWDPPVTAKRCPEETHSSVVEIMSEDDVSGLEKQSQESSQLLSPEGSFSSREQVDGSPGTEFFPDYVTLNKDSVILCPNGNKYMYEQVGEKGDPRVRDELLNTCHCSCTDGSVCVSPCLGCEFLNHSYFPLAEAADKFNCKVTANRGHGNLYTNFPCS